MNSVKKVYDAEEMLKRHGAWKFSSIKDIRKFVAKIDPKIKVVAYKGDKAFACYERNRIELPRWSYHKYIVLHEVAHCQRRKGDHGWRFCKRYLELVKEHMSHQAYIDLKIAFLKHGVRWYKLEKQLVS